MKQLEVQIMGQSYLLGCPEEGDERLRTAVERVDEAMCKIRDGGKVRARDRIAVLAALNLAFDLADQDQIPTVAPDRTTPTSQGLPSVNNDPQLASLLERLDRALGDDGRLL